MKKKQCYLAFPFLWYCNSVIIELIRFKSPSESEEVCVAKLGPPLPGLICTLVVMEPSAKTLMLPLTL